MLRFLFPALTAAPERGEAMFTAITAAARQRHWYVEGEVPDSLDGRFRVLATLAALVAVRLEQEGSQGDRASVAMTERFIEVMESEHREFGLGDPTLGKTVRKLVGALARRVDMWRSAVTEPARWRAAVDDSVYNSGGPAAGIDHAARALESFWAGVQAQELGAIVKGKFR